MGAWPEVSRKMPDTANAARYLLNPEFSVFGWHPYWEGNAYLYYDFSLLTHVSYFAYELDPQTGLWKDLNGWDTTGLVTYAKQRNPACKVLLTVSCFGSDNTVFLTTPPAQKRLNNTLVKLLQEKKADGITLDLEGIEAGYSPQLNTFIRNLHHSLKTADTSFILTLALPAVDYEQVFDMDTLSEYVDLFVIMGYDYHGATGGPGPIAPLHPSTQWGELSVSQSVSYYLSQKTPRKKLLVGLPYFGAIWQGTNNTPTENMEFVGYRPYSYQLSEGPGVFKYIASAGGMRWQYPVKEPAGYQREWWGEDTASLGAKYDWILAQELGGIGIWALGYDEGSQNLWNLLGEKFSTDKIEPPPSPAPPEPKPSPGANFLEWIETHSDLVFFTLLIIYFGIVTGVILALVSPEVKNYLLLKKRLRAAWILVGMLLILPVGLYLNVVESYTTFEILVLFSILLFMALSAIQILQYVLGLRQRDIP